jgi:hypothetical protein
VAVNFLHVNYENYFITVYFSKIAATIIVSRKLVKMGRKSSLFMYYVELIDAELWMVEEVAALNGGLESMIMEGKIRRGIRK